MNDLEALFFLISATVSVASALVVVLAKRVVYAVLMLVVSMVALSVLFVLLEAHFVAMIQILIYAGAIMVLFLLVVMLLGIEGVEQSSAQGRNTKGLLMIPIVLLVALGAELAYAIWNSTVISAETSFLGTVEAIGNALFTQYLLPFELVSVILLIGIFGVVGLSQGKRKQSA